MIPSMKSLKPLFQREKEYEKEQNQTNTEQKPFPHKTNILQIKDKINIIEYIEEGHIILSAVEKFKVPRISIDTWIKSKDTLIAFKNGEKKCTRLLNQNIKSKMKLCLI